VDPASAKIDPATTFQQIHGDFLRGNLDSAEQKAEKARKDFAADGDWAMRFRLLEAEILTDEGRRPEVVALLNSPGVNYPSTGDLAIRRNLLAGLAHARLGQPAQADSELHEAERLSGMSHATLSGEVLRTEAVVQIYRGHLPESADLSQKSLKIAREQRDSFLESSDLLNLGLVAVETRHYDEALQLLGGAADAARPIQARVILELALGNLGLAYLQLGDFERALSNSLQAAQEGKNIGTESLRVSWLINAASSQYRLGNLSEARTTYEQALKTATAIDAAKEVAGIEAELAFLLYQQGQFDLAKTHDEQAVRAAQRTENKTDELEARYTEALLATRDESRPQPERLLLQVSHEASDPAIQGEIYGALGDFYAARQQATKADLWYRKAVRSFEEQRAGIADEELRLPFFANGDGLYRRYADFLIESHKADGALQLLDAGRARTLEEGLSMAKQKAAVPKESTIDVEGIARKLSAVILFYSLGPQKSWLWAVTPHHTRLFPLPGQPTIQAQVQNYQNAILRSSDPLREENPAAQMLYDTLVGPAASMIPGGSKVVVVPDGDLNGLNFETLLAPGPGGSHDPSGPRLHYWIDDVTVTSANSIRMLSRVDPAVSAGNNKKLLLIGNPTAAGTGYNTLVNAFAEIRGIEKHFPAGTRTVVTQSEAVPGAYQAESPDEFSYIHFVAHGTASRLDPLDSAIVLSPSAQNPDNFKLYARDIMRFPLHARLVTISSCYGSGLRAYAGEGLVGLSWAFLRAGAHNVIGALWEVNDASTPLLMDRLYGAIEAGDTPDTALRAAKLSLIHSQAVYRKPLYWGGFQLYTGS
jgi:CHAT domain-containing protein/tetratricopeptide (TPR) repeat protein